MTTTLEKAKKAVLNATPIGYGMTDGEAEIYTRAVLMAVRIPDDAMEDAGEAGYRDNAPDENSRISPYAIGKSFTAMIDHILNEPATPE